MGTLQIAPDFSLPLDLVVQQAAILARTGAGKTNAATVIVEELLSAGQQVVIIDPPGAWWGLTASSDGSKGGYPVVVFGGEHGDLPLSPTSGALIADIIVDTGVSAILDLSDLSNAQISSFVLAFAARLYERKARVRSPLLLVIEEADEVAPQRAMPDQTRMLGAIERVVKRGRMRGIGTLMISQRSASLNKNVLSQAELLIAMQTTAPQDIKAIDAWIEHHGDQEKRQQLIGEIATLGKGEAFIWSPGWLHEFRKIRFRLRRTFDSSATPKPGEVLTEPTARADVDLDAIKALLNAAVQVTDKTAGGAGATAQRDQSRALAEQRRLLEEKDAYIATLEGELRQLRARPSFDTDRLAHDVAAMESAAMRVIDAASELKAEMARSRPAPEGPPKPLENMPEIIPRTVQASPPTPKREHEAMFSEASKQPRSVKQSTAPNRQPAQNRRSSPIVMTPTDLSNPQVRILEALGSFQALGIDIVARSNVAVFAGASPTSSGFANNLGALRTKSLIDYPASACVRITDAGLACVDEPKPIRSLAELHEAWYAKLPRPQATILREVVREYPSSWDRPDLAAYVGQSATSSGYANNLGALRSLGLIDYPSRGQIVATSLLFPEGLR